MPTADAESQRRSEGPSADGIWQKRLMPSTDKNGVSLVEASSGERPILQETSDQKATSSARVQWTQTNGMWTKHPGCPPAGASSSGRSWQAEKSSTIDDFFPKIGEDPEADLLINWTQVNGIWMKYPGGPPGEKSLLNRTAPSNPLQQILVSPQWLMRT